MSLYNYYVIYEISKNKTFLMIIIKNNEIECDNEIIKKDIENKIKKIDVKNTKFYISLYDYEMIEKDDYWNTIKNLERKQLPIYKKDEDLKDFLLWYENNFNNNKVDIFETNKFTKRKSVFSSREQCLESVKWEQTNPKFNVFNQLFYHAGDMLDIERYGYIYIRTMFNKINNINLDKNVFKNDEIKIWDKFETTFESINNTMEYMFHKMKKGILIGIKNNRLIIFLPFSKYNYQNDFYSELYFDENDKKLLKEYEKTKNKNLLKKLNNNVKYYLNKYHLHTNNVELDRRKWIANDCFFKYEKYEGDQNVSLFEDFFVELCINRKVPDSIFFLNVRDHPMLNKNLKDSYTSIVDKQLDEKYLHEKYAPILTVGASKENVDIPCITQDDWLRVSKRIYPDDCKNNYINYLKKIEWKNKKNMAIFRGTATGCDIDDKNVRIKASILSKQYPDLLNAGIVKFNRKLKKKLNEPLNVINPKIQKSNFMTLEEQNEYKYILNLDGHVSAFRLSNEFSLNSVVLIPKSKYYLWFSFLLKPYEHYVPVDENLDNLIEQIKWCKNNDDKCYEISKNGMEFYKKYLEKDGIYDYMQKVLYQINSKGLEFKKYNKKIAIITCYRNQNNNERLIQKRYFVYWMNKILSQICDYDLIVVEQNENDKFNIGKLKNIGFEYLNKKNKKKYDNYIFTDIDTIPDHNLIDYYFKITNSLNSLAIYGTRYEHMDIHHNTPFVGAQISCSYEVFKDLNGYGNNFYGWQGEDENLLFRLYELKKPLYKVKKGGGRVIDIEEMNNKLKSVKEKIDELNKDKSLRENEMYEKNMNYKNFKENGLNNLNYKLMNEFEYDKNYHIIVDLKKEESEKLYPQDYFFENKYEKTEYKKLKQKIFNNIKQIDF